MTSSFIEHLKTLSVLTAKPGTVDEEDARFGRNVVTVDCSDYSVCDGNSDYDDLYPVFDTTHVEIGTYMPFQKALPNSLSITIDINGCGGERFRALSKCGIKLVRGWCTGVLLTAGLEAATRGFKSMKISE